MNTHTCTLHHHNQRRQLNAYEWESYGDVRLVCFLEMIAMFVAFYQERLPYHVVGVEANDDLYGRDPNYRRELQTVLNILFSEMLKVRRVPEAIFGGVGCPAPVFLGINPTHTPFFFNTRSSHL